MAAPPPFSTVLFERIPEFARIVRAFALGGEADTMSDLVEFFGAHPYTATILFSLSVTVVFLPLALGAAWLFDDPKARENLDFSRISTLTQKGNRSKIVLCDLGQNPKHPFPNASPFVLKLDAALRDCGVSFETKSVPFESLPSSNRKIPVVHWNGKVYSDSQLILDLFVKEGVIETHPDVWLDAQARAKAKMFRLGIENMAYYGLTRERWLDQWSKSRAIFWPTDASNFIFLHVFAPLFVKPAVKATLKAVGVLSYSAETWDNVMESFWEDAAVILGNKRYFFGDEQLCSADYAAFGYLCNVLAFESMNPKLYKVVSKHENLVKFVACVTKKLYPEAAVSQKN
ncbi:hypothetical protein BC830DRAFT_1165541 [Chytriomyces sp. MP71]|nr:hypothetical protein BC830DRAFT_1165541 [Chytriomyces sp. MP71]